MLTKDNVVYGERVKDLLPGLLKFRDAATFDDDGHVDLVDHARSDRRCASTKSTDEGRSGVAPRRR
jgi:hypothetical protein